MNKKIFSEQEIVRRKKLQKLIKNGENPFQINKFHRSHTSIQFYNDFNKYTKNELYKINILKNIQMAGRIKTIRNMGKSTFASIQDQYGIFQIYIKKDEIGDLKYSKFINLDLGDIIGVIGIVMKTNTNELTLKISLYQLLSKSIKPLPEKYHGIKNIEIKYRNRYIDFIMSPQIKNIFIQRSKIIRLIRIFFDKKGYLEVETPILQTIYGGALAKPFITKFNALKTNFYLRVAPELSLKKLIIGGFEGVYEIGRLFRNEGIDNTHNPEFTTVELYIAYKDMEYMMSLTENIFCFIIKNIFQNNKILYDNKQIFFNKPWKKIHMVDAIKKNTGINFWNKISLKEAKQMAINNNIYIKKNHNSVGHIINLFFEKFVEHTLIQPTFIFGYPVEISPLAKTNEYDIRFTNRFELFINGIEYVNAYSELNDPIEQIKRFKKQYTKNFLGNKEINKLNNDFIEALEYGMPPTGGLGIGIDRLVMLLTNQKSIKDILLFPHMKLKKTTNNY